MVRNEYRSSLYRSLTEMLDAIAEDWVSASGAYDEAAQREYMSDMSNAEITEEVINFWELDRNNYGEVSHMELNEYTSNDLAAAFGRLRKRLYSNFVVDANGNPVDFDAVVVIMCDDIREEINSNYEPGFDNPQKFFEEYARRHEETFGAPFAPWVGGAW